MIPPRLLGSLQRCSMLRLLFICFSLLVVPSFSLKVSSGPQIDPVIVLLPWSPPELSEQRVVFTLRAFGGCFEWTSQRPDLIEVTSLPGPNECSTEAVVSQRAALPIQDKAWVFARDRETQTELRCEVHVAPLSSIVIDTPTRSIGVEAVETLSLRGFDKLGNVFSSLERLWFKWSSSDTGVLSFGSLDSDVYRSSPSRLLVQHRGGQPDVVLLKGVSSGRSVVTVSLDSKGHPLVPPASVVLDVSEPLFIDPPFLRVPPYSEINFGLRILKQKMGTAASPLIQFPSPNFIWSTSFDVHPRLGQVFINSTQETVGRVIVTDRRIANNTASAVVTVSMLSRLDLYVSSTHLINLEFSSNGKISSDVQRSLAQFESGLHLPFANISSPRPINSLGTDQQWVLVKGREYTVGVLGYDQRGHELYLAKNFAFRLNCKTKAELLSAVRSDMKNKMSMCLKIEPLWLSEAERFLSFRATEIGRGFLQFSTRKSPNGNKTPADLLPEPFIVEKEFLVVEPLSIRDRSTEAPAVLPIDHSWTFEAIGGSGLYSWSTTNSSVVEVSGNGAFGNIRARAFGTTELKVRDIKNPLNFYTFSVIVAPVGRLLLDPRHVQTHVNTAIEVRIRAFPDLSEYESLADWPLFKSLDKLLDSLGQQQYPPLPVGRGFQRFSDELNSAGQLLDFHFLNCTSLDSRSLSISSSDRPQRLVVEAVKTSSGEPIEGQRYIATPSDPYVCGVLRLTPQAIGSLDVMAHLSNAPISSLSDCEVGCLRSAVQLEVFSPVTLDSVADIPWVPTPPAAIAEFDRHIDSPFTIAVGSSVNLAIRGGPPSIGHVHSEILVDTQTPGPKPAGVHVKGPKGNALQITCLRDGGRIILTVTCQSVTQKRSTSDAIQDTNKTVPYMPAVSRSQTVLDIHCAFPAVLEIHAQDATTDLVRPTTSLAVDTPKFAAEIFVRCAKAHKFGIFVFAKDGRTIHHWNSYEAEWAIKTAAESSPSRFLNNGSTTRDVLVPREVCKGEVSLEVSVKLSVKATLALLTEGVLKGEKSALNKVQQEFKRLGGQLAARTIPRWTPHLRSREFYLLVDRVKLFPVPLPRFSVEQPLNDVSIRPFFFHPQWARRVYVYFGSGHFRIERRIGKDLSRLTTLSCHSRATVPPTPLSATALASVRKPAERIEMGLLGCLDAAPLVRVDETPDALFGKRGVQHFTPQLPQSYCDLVLQAFEPSAVLSLAINDERLLGSEEVLQHITFSKMSKIQIKLGSRFFRSNQRSNTPLEMGRGLESSRHSLELFSVFSVVAEVLDASGARFPESQFPLMKLCLNSVNRSGIRLSCLSPTGADRMIFLDGSMNDVNDDDDVDSEEPINTEARLLWNSVKGMDNGKMSFLIQGLRAGSYEIKVTGVNYPDEIVSSNSLHFDIFEPLSISPPHLLLMPGGHSFELTVLGGPFPSSGDESGLKFSISNSISKDSSPSSELIELSALNSKFPLITTKMSTGNAVIHVQTSGADPSLNISFDVHIKVDIPHRISIISPIGLSDRRIANSIPHIELHTGDAQVLMAGLLSKSGQLFSLSHLLMPSGSVSPLDVVPERCEFDWTSSAPEIVKLSSLQLSEHQLKGAGLISVIAESNMTPGKSIVTVTVHCGEYQSTPASLFSWSSPPGRKPVFSFHGSAQISVTVSHSPNSFRHDTFANSMTSEDKRLPNVLRLTPYGIYRIAPEMTAYDSSLSASLLEFGPNNSFMEVQRFNSSGVFGSSKDLQLRPACGGICFEIHIFSIPKAKSWILSLRTSKTHDAQETMSVPIVVSPICSVSVSSPLFGTGAPSFAILTVRDCQGKPMLTPINAQFSAISSHPSILSVGPWQPEMVNNIIVSSITLPVPLITGKRGCAGVSFSIQPQSQEPLSIASRLCVDSPLLPADRLIHLVPGSLVRAIVDPERLSDDIKFSLKLRLKSHIALSELKILHRCIITDVVDDGCSLWNFAQKQHLPKWASKCRVKKGVTIRTVEASLSEKIKSEMNAVLQHLFSKVNGWSLTSSVIVQSTSDPNWMTYGDCPHHNAGLEAFFTLSIHRETLIDSKRSASTLLDGVWETIAQPPSSIQLRVLSGMEWSSGVYPTSSEETTGQQWASDRPSIVVSSRGYVSSLTPGLGRVTLKSESVSGSLNIEIHDTLKLCSIISEDSLAVKSQSCVSEFSSKSNNNFGSINIPTINRSIILPFIPFAGDIPLLSSPFISQRLDVSCVPEDQIFLKFFNFLPSHSPIRHSGLLRSTPSCLLNPRFPNFRDLTSISLPSRLNLDVSLRSSGTTSQRIRIFKFSSEFTPALIVDDATSPFSEGLPSSSLGQDKVNSRSLLLSKDLTYPITFRVWTGGRKAELSSSPVDSSLFTASIVGNAEDSVVTVKVSWLEAVQWQRGRFHEDEPVDLTWWNSLSALLLSGGQRSPRQQRYSKAFRPVIKQSLTLTISNDVSRVEIPIIFTEGGGQRLESIATFYEGSTSTLRSIGTAIVIIILLFAGVILYDHIKHKSCTIEIPPGVARLSPTRHSTPTSPNRMDIIDYGVGGYTNTSPNPRFLSQTDPWTDIRQRRRLSQDWQ